MSGTSNNNNMAVHERSGDDKSITTENKHNSRLYPSLPCSNRFNAFGAECCADENSPPAADFHTDTQPEDSQAEAPATSREGRQKAQILILTAQKQELLSINEKWAKEYRTLRQYYKEKVENLKALLQHSYSQFEEEVSEEGEMNERTKVKTLRDNRVTWVDDADDVSSELLKARMEAKELEVQNNTLTRRGQRQAEEIRRLNRALEEALQKTSPPDVSSETLQEVWKQQTEVYKEDFFKERRDREKLKEKYLDLEKKFRKVQSELRVLKSQVALAQAPQPALECTCRAQTKCEKWEVRQINEHHMVLQRR